MKTTTKDTAAVGALKKEYKSTKYNHKTTQPKTHKLGVAQLQVTLLIIDFGRSNLDKSINRKMCLRNITSQIFLLFFMSLY